MIKFFEKFIDNEINYGNFAVENYSGITTVFFARLLFFIHFSYIELTLSNKIKIPETIQKDITSRFAKAEIRHCSIGEDGSMCIYLYDANNNGADLIYRNNEFEAEYRIIPDFEDLPLAVQTAFDSLSIQGISNLTIYKTQRSYLKHELYTFNFVQTTNKVRNLQYNIFINEDGKVLLTINHSTADEAFLFSSYLTEFNYIEQNYEQADVRCQLAYPGEYSGDYTLIISHDGYIKSQPHS